MSIKSKVKKTLKSVPGAYRLAKAVGLVRDYYAEFLADCRRVYDRYLAENAAKDPKGYVILMDINHRITTGLMVPVSLDLLKRGYAVCSVIKGRMNENVWPDLDGISGSIAHGSWAVDGTVAINHLVKRWTIDWDAGIVSCDGVNYFPFFLERLSKLSKSYRGSLTTKAEISLFNAMLRQSDAVLAVCDRIIKLAEKGRPIRLVAMDSHFAPWGVIRRWCDAVGKAHDINFIALSSGYENYYSNLSTMEATTLAVENLTANPDLRHPFLGGQKRFEEFIAKHPETLEGKATALGWIKVNRSRVTSDDPARAEVQQKVQAARVAGRPVFAAFGKVLIDFAAPDDCGNVYPDFPTWMNGLVELAAESKSLLIIKPHPHEIRPEIVNDGVQVLRDLLPHDLPENVIFLNHNSFNSYELAGVVDASFVWNGTICCEFPVLDCPVVPESIWAARDYPLGLPSMGSEQDYRDLFSGQRVVPLDETMKNRAAAFLHFLKSDEVMIPFRYLRRAGTNQTIGKNWLYHKELTKLETKGDAAIERAASRFFE